MSDSEHVKQSPDTIAIRITAEWMELTVQGSKRQFPNEDASYALVMDTYREARALLVVLVANHGLEQPLAEWLKKQGVTAVVLEISEPSALGSVVDQVDQAGQSLGQAKLILTSMIALIVGLGWTLVTLAQFAQGAQQVVGGGIWKGPLIALLGFVLLLIVGKNRKSAPQ